MSRTVKQDIDLLFDIEKQVIEKLNPDFTRIEEVEHCHHYVDLIFENQNKWLLSDKISSEKQARMDQFKESKGSNGDGDVSDAPTQRQISYATTLGIDVEGKGYTKKTLSAEIEKVKGKQK